MTRTNDAARVDGEALPEANHSMIRHNLKLLSMKELDTLCDGISLGIEAMNGIICQPRFGDGGGGVLNAAGDELDGVISYLYECRNMIEQVAEEAAPTDPAQAKERAWLLLKIAAGNKDHLPTFLVKAAQLLLDHSDVEFDHHHARRQA